MSDRLRALWDFDDLAGTELRLRTAVEESTDASGRAEVLTQLARVAGLRGDLDAGARLLEEAGATAAGSAAVAVRVELERGRLRRTAGDLAAALPCFAAAYDAALGAALWYLAADAAHMAALAAPTPQEAATWTRRGLALAEEHPDAAYWAGPLWNNAGWAHDAVGELEQALEAFQGALAARERDPDRPRELAIARYAVGRALRRLDRPAEAVPLLELATAWAEDAGVQDGWFHEELAEDYAAVGRDDEARAQALLALPLLETDDPSLAGDGERVARLRALAGA